jgi:ectoine hydroxylase-related dioxygenase (phytanoyl-CoA dioxygenase family)
VASGSHLKTTPSHCHRTLAARAGDAVALDYRLLHATHANRSDVRRDALIVNFTPSWKSLPDDIRAHLIRQPALPTAEETDDLLPRFEGTPRDLPLSREAPEWSSSSIPAQT